MTVKFASQLDVVVVLRAIIDQLYYEMTVENIIDDDTYSELALASAQLFKVSKIALEGSKS